VLSPGGALSQTDSDAKVWIVASSTVCNYLTVGKATSFNCDVKVTSIAASGGASACIVSSGLAPVLCAIASVVVAHYGFGGFLDLN
jgi:hypothetical protein